MVPRNQAFRLLSEMECFFYYKNRKVSRVEMRKDEQSRVEQSSENVPVSVTLPGDLETPINLFLKLRKETNCCLLESVEGGEKWGRYSYIGRNPRAVITAFGDQVTIVERDGSTICDTGDSLKVIENYLKSYKTANLPDLPDFIGGAVGQISFGSLSFSQTSENRSNTFDEIPDVHLLVFDEIIAYDHLKQQIQVIVNSFPNADNHLNYDQANNRLLEIKDEILSLTTTTNVIRTEQADLPLDVSSNETVTSFISKVRQAKQHVAVGDVSQVVLSQRFIVKTDVDPLDCYGRLRTINPSPFLFYLNFGDYQLAGSSPELLVRVQHNVVETCPIAGTRKRGITLLEDQKLVAELLADQKELTEHDMLVNLSINDLSKVSERDSVRTKNPIHVEKFSHVMHLVTNVVGKLRPGLTGFDALKACFPAGTVSGFPKAKALEIISDLENDQRGVYGGVVGYFGFNDSLDMSIAIRTIVFQQGKAYLQAGAGIVADSQPEKEYQETLDKAQALLEAIKQAAVIKYSIVKGGGDHV